MRRRLFLTGTLLLAGVSLLVLYIDQRDTASQNTNLAGLSVGAIHTITLPDTYGKMHPLGEWGQKLLIINFWATWCAPCKEEIPLLIDMQAQYGNMIQIVGIASDNSLNISNFKKETPFNYPILLDEAGAIALSKRFGNSLGVLPYTVVVHPQRGIIFTHAGKVEHHEIARIIAKNIIKINQK